MQQHHHQQQPTWDTPAPPRDTSQQPIVLPPLRSSRDNSRDDGRGRMEDRRRNVMRVESMVG
jgi:hypothetical protein